MNPFFFFRSRWRVRETPDGYEMEPMPGPPRLWAWALLLGGSTVMLLLVLAAPLLLLWVLFRWLGSVFGFLFGLGGSEAAV